MRQLSLLLAMLFHCAGLCEAQGRLPSLVDSYPSYFLDAGVLRRADKWDSPLRCDVFSAAKSKRFEIYYPGRASYSLRSGVSGKYVGIVGVVSQSDYPYLNDTIPFMGVAGKPCEQYDLKSPCVAAIAIVDVPRCKVVGVTGYLHDPPLYPDQVEFLFSDDDELVFVEDGKYFRIPPRLRIFRLPKVSLVAQYDLHIADGAAMRERRPLECFPSGFCALLAGGGWLVIDTRSGKLVASRADVDLPQMDRDSLKERYWEVPPAAALNRVEEGEVLTRVQPLWADSEIWVQLVETESRSAGTAVASKRLLVATRGYQRDRIAFTELPKGAENLTVLSSGERRLVCEFDFEGGRNRVPISLPEAGSPQEP